MQPVDRTVTVLIDYQNIHLTGHSKFSQYGTARHLTLVHPLYFANAVLTARRVAQGIMHEPSILSRVVAYRGLPSNEKAETMYRRSQAQKSEWTRDPRVEVVLRPLRYPADWPTSPPQEKGIDVLLALELVRCAERHSSDVVILASHDTDLEPALEWAEQVPDVRIETAGWSDCKRLRGGTGRRWHTFLNDRAFARCCDLKDYDAK